MDLPLSFDQIAPLLLKAAQSGNWAFLLAAALMLAVWAVRKYLAPKIPWLNSDPAGVAMTFLFSSLAALFTALAAGQPFTWPLAIMGAKVSFFAMGGYSALRKLLAPALGLLLPLAAKVFGAGQAAAQDAKAGATAAGDAAAKTAAPQSIDSFLGKGP